MCTQNTKKKTDQGLWFALCHCLGCVCIYHELNYSISERGTCIKGLLWPPLEPKIENCFHKFLLIGLLEEWLKCKISHLFKSYRCFGNKNGRQNRLKIEKLSFLAKFNAFRDRIFKN